MKTILVQNHTAVDRNMGCTLPFSCRIKDCLEELWVHALQREGILHNFFPCYVFLSFLNHVCSLEEFTFSFSFNFSFNFPLKDIFACLSTGHSIKQFEEFFWKTPLGRYISEATQEMQMEFFHRYLQDFISMTMNVTSEVDLKVRNRPFQS